MARFSLRTFDKILDDVREARVWYESIGISTTGTRLQLIEERIVELLSDLQSSTPELVVEKWDTTDTYYALSDGAGFGRISREISKVGPNLLPKKTLRSLLEGPLSPKDEILGDASVNARNLFTELELAADLSEKGIQPTGFDDLSFRFEGVSFSIQCKRLLGSSRETVKANIDRAYNQLKRNLQSDRDRGLIALAIDKVMGLEGKILRLEEEADLTTEVHRLVEEFRIKYGHSWWGFIDPRVVGIIIILRFLCYTVKQNVVGPAYYIAFANLASPEAFQASDLELLRSLTTYLQRASRRDSGPL